MKNEMTQSFNGFPKNKDSLNRINTQNNEQNLSKRKDCIII